MEDEEIKPLFNYDEKGYDGSLDINELNCFVIKC